MASCLVALGSNLGESRSILQQAIERLDHDPAIVVVRRSRWLVTVPVGGPAGQPDFVNGALRLETSLSPEQLHARLRDVETQLGRQRRQRWAARTIDLDLLLYDQQVRDSDQLTLPHPRMAFRRFVLEPAAEVGGELRHPHIGWTVNQLWDHLQHAANYVALTGPAGTGKSQRARQLARAMSWRYLADPAATAVPNAPESLILERRAAELQKSAAKSSAGMVSDFWIGQSLVNRRVPAEEPGDGFQQHWTQVAEQCITPKLLVLLTDSGRDAAAERCPGPLPPDVQLQKPPPAAEGTEVETVVWKNAVRWYYQGPRLYLEPGQPERAFAELTAAVQAMT